MIIDAVSRSITVDGERLSDAKNVVGTVEFEDHLLVAQRDGVVLIYELASAEEGSLPKLVQRIDQLGRELADIVAVPETGRVLVLAAGSTEVFGIRFYEQRLLDEGEVDQPAFVNHARFFEFLRDDAGDMATPRLFALGSQSLALVTDSEIIELFHFDRTYRVLSRNPIPQALARVEGLAFSGTAWIMTGLDKSAEPVLFTALTTSGPWSDMGVKVLDDALAADGEPIAWLPGRLAIQGSKMSLAIRGERGAVATWPASSDAITPQNVAVKFLEQP